MKILALTLVEVGGIEDQARRVFEWSADGNFTQDIIDVVERSPSKLSLDSFIGNSQEIMSLSTDVEQVYIPGISNRGGFAERRFRFVLEMELEPKSQYNNSRTRAIVQGYTDHADLSMNDLVDPNTEMYLNNIVTVKDVTERDGRIRTRIINVSQTVLGDLSHSDFLVRPSDVFASMENDEYMFSDGIEVADIMDTRMTFHGGTQLNERRINSPAHYIHRLVSSDMEARDNLDTREPNFYDDSRDSLAYESAGGNIQTIRSNKFLRALADNNRSFTYENRFRYRDLELFCGHGELDDLTLVATIDGFGEFESESWTGASAEVKAAAQICHLIPIIMFDCFIDSIVFDTDNLDSHGTDSAFVITDMTSMLGEHAYVPEMIRVFEARVRKEVFNLISNNGHMSVDLHVDAEVCGMTIITISIDGGHHDRYTFPSFADSLLSPVVSNNQDTIINLADGYRNVRSHVDSVLGGRIEIDLSTDVRGAVRERDMVKQPTRVVDLSNRGF